MKKRNLKLDACLANGLALLMLLTGVAGLSSCSDDDGLTEGDAGYFTSTRGQFTATIDDGNGNKTTLYLIPGSTAGTALVTYDGSNPKHWQSSTNTTVRIGTYQNDIVIPETVEVGGTTYTIVGLDKEAFMGNREYSTTVNSVKTVYWSGLKTIQLPASVSTLGEGAFAICTNLSTFPTLPAAVSEIPLGCFATCTDLRTVDIPATVKTVGEMAFYGDVRLQTLTFAEGVETIGRMAFFDCRSTSLTTVTIPSTVTRIGDQAFGGRGMIYNSSGVGTDWRTHIASFYVKAKTPPTLEGSLYGEPAEGVSPVVYVPAGCVAAYKAAPGWSSLTIEEE